MRLYLLRHALAVPRGAAEYRSDAQRPLTNEGRAQARRVAQGLKRLDPDVDVIVTSPYLRAAQTSREVAGVFGARARVKELDALRADVDPRDTSRALAQLDAHERVVLVGHEPHLGRWLAELVAADGRIQCVIKKGGIACVEVKRVPPPPGSGTLRWLMTPKQLSLIGRSE